jgi:L-iditol 2-dehydrogenase
MATPPVDGAWAEYVAVRSDFLFKLPDGMSFEEGALLEPLSVGFHAMQRARVGPKDKVLVTGLGPIGLLAMAAAKMFGVNRLYGSDVVEFRRDLAMQMGASGVFNPLDGNLPAAVAGALDEDKADVVIETSGNPKAISDTVNLVKRGGRIVLIGLPTTDAIPLDIPSLIDAELDVYGVFRYANTYPAAIQALGNGNRNISQVITHKFGLHDIIEAVELARTNKERSIKVMIYPQREMQSGD